MIETAAAQLRLGASLVFGRPFSTRSLDRLVESIQATIREFGSVGDEAGELLGPALDDDALRLFAGRRFRKLAVRAGRDTRYYRELFAGSGIDPRRLDWDAIPTVPVTPKQALRDDPDAFVRAGSRPVLRGLTTGTTGRPTSVFFSREELDAGAALGAADLLVRGQVSAEDVFQICVSSRAFHATIVSAGVCARIGAPAYLAGLVEPEYALRLLAERRSLPGKKERASILSTYPSYLGELVETARRLGFGPSDFGLERIFLSGEVVSGGLRARAAAVFGEASLVEVYSATEIVPFGGAVCSQGHLHFPPSSGLLELVSLDGGAPQAGEPAAIVATPFPPFRDTTLVLRYATEDVVRVLDRRPDCELRALPATSRIVGKLRLAVRHDGGWTFPRDVVDALEEVEDVPLPARYGFARHEDGVRVEVVARTTAPVTRAAIAASLECRGIPLRELRVVTELSELRAPLPLRCDLREHTFALRDEVSA